MTKKSTYGPPSKYDISIYELGVLHIIRTDNPESTRVILGKQARREKLRYLFSVGENHVKMVLWNYKMLKGAK